MGTRMIAKRMEELQGSGIRKMFELAASMKNPINLSLGQADFDVPENIKAAAMEAIKAGHNRYSVTAGIPEFQKAIIDALAREGVKAEATMAVCGASGGLLLSLLAMAGEGDEVLVPDPYFVSYGNLIKMTGAQPRWIDTYPDFKLTPAKLEASITPRSKILIFNSPVNPTGIAYTPDEIADLARCARRHGLKVISDEVYDDPDAILVRSFSKTWGMPGWRAGYVAGPAEIVNNMKVLQQFTFVCVTTPVQWACIEALKTDVSDYRNAYRKKRDAAFDILSEGFEVVKPQGAFYVFPKVPEGKSEEFLKRCVEREILIVPGGAFSTRNTHCRVSYALDDVTLKRGLKSLVEVAKSI
jgi:aspartate/methionine/tyrosine aminotransferase